MRPADRSAADPEPPAGSAPPAAAPVRVAVVAGVLAVCALTVPVSTGLADRPALGWLAGLAAVLAGATAVAVRGRSPAAVRLALFADGCLLAVAVGGIAVWPAPVAVALAGLWLLARRWPALAPVAPWLRRGRMTADLPWLVAATVALSAGALVAYAVLAEPAVSPFLSWLGAQPGWLVVLGVLGFALVNAAGEEVLFRGVLQSELAAVWSPVAAVVVTGLGFGLAHHSGFPGGWVGVAMAAVYGLALGVVRLRSAGLLAPFLAHVAADLTIGLLAVLLLT